jgi:hypothetical protein
MAKNEGINHGGIGSAASKPAAKRRKYSASSSAKAESQLNVG